MTALETLRTGIESVLLHRMRSILTVVGITIGITAVILTVGLGEGAQQQVGSEISALGTDLLVVSPGSTTGTGGIRGGFGSASTLTEADAQALANPTVAPDIRAVAPVLSRSVTLVAGSSNWTTTGVGTDPSWLTVRNRTVAEGRFLDQADLATTQAVAVLGPTTASELFANRNPVGQTVSVDGTPFTVVGVLNSVGSTGSSSSNQDDQIVVPITTASERLLGGSSRDTLSQILFSATSSSALNASYQEATDELLALHGITSPANADFTVQSQQSLLTTATGVDRTLTVLLAGIAAIALLVGGIGVMNVMLVSVTERTREIGLRKALGATRRSIRNQFLIEASALGLAGGLAGALLGIVGALTLPHAVGNPISISATATVGAILVSIAIGMVFGVFPAARAARLAPIDALRAE